MLNFTPESLVPLWEWFLRRRRGRRDRDGELPLWYVPDPPEDAAERLSPATLRDIDAVGLYLAEVFLRNVDGAVWGIGKLPKRMKYVHQNKPVVKIGEQDVDPIGVAYATRCVASSWAYSPDALLQAYRANLA